MMIPKKHKRIYEKLKRGTKRRARAEVVLEDKRAKLAKTWKKSIFFCFFICYFKIIFIKKTWNYFKKRPKIGFRKNLSRTLFWKIYLFFKNSKQLNFLFKSRYNMDWHPFIFISSFFWPFFTSSLPSLPLILLETILIYEPSNRMVMKA